MEETPIAQAPLPAVPEAEPALERRASRAEVIETVHRLGGELSANELTEAAIESRYRRLHADAVALFGSWEVALATALRTALAGQRGPLKRPPTPSPISGDQPIVGAARRRRSVLRQPHPNAQRPVLVATHAGELVRVSGEMLTASEVRRRAAGIPGLDKRRPTGIFDVAGATIAIGVTRDGMVQCLDPTRLCGPSDPIVESGDWIALFDADDVAKSQTLVLVTRSGKTRAVKVVEMLEALDGADTWRACVLKNGDAPVAALLADPTDAALLASSTGHVITFDLAALRSSSRPAAPVAAREGGVRGMQLKDGATVVGAMLAKPGTEVALITERGDARRIPVDTFRPQGRGGLGSRCTRLAEDDRLVAAIGCHASTDLALVTNRGRVLRIPATSLPVSERLADAAASIIELDADEIVASASRLLPLAYASDAPNAFEI